ncbi:hypothetical protein SAMN05428981_1272 [Bacillus sp. OV194]|nr:hypothetical protein SAMN05428981_1272 [Bacillus sp. OV194]
MHMEQIDLFEVMTEADYEATVDEPYSEITSVVIGDEVKVIINKADTTEDRSYKEDFLKGKGKVIKMEQTREGKTVCYVSFSGKNREAVLYDSDLLICIN